MSYKGASIVSEEGQLEDQKVGRSNEGEPKDKEEGYVLKRMDGGVGWILRDHSNCCHSST